MVGGNAGAHQIRNFGAERSAAGSRPDRVRRTPPAARPRSRRAPPPTGRTYGSHGRSEAVVMVRSVSGTLSVASDARSNRSTGGIPETWGWGPLTDGPWLWVRRSLGPWRTLGREGGRASESRPSAGHRSTPPICAGWHLRSRSEEHTSELQS